MSFIAIIPARLASTRLPDKPLADIGGVPMVVRTARQALRSGAQQVVVATDHARIVAACQAHDIPVCLTRADHPSGTDRIAEVAAMLDLPDTSVLVNVQGDEPLIDPQLIADVASRIDTEIGMATAAHALHTADDLFNPNIVKVVLDARLRALYFSRAPIPWARDAFAHDRQVLPEGLPVLRHIGLYAYRHDVLRRVAALPAAPLEQFEALEQLRVLWHGIPIAVHLAACAPAAGVDTAEDLARVRARFA